jgi:hypothetical protein
MRCVHTNPGHNGCIPRQCHAKRRPPAPAMGLYRAASVLSAAVLTSLLGIGATPAAAATCASLAGLALPDTTITAAQPVAAGTYTAPDGEVFTNLPAFCRIAATLTPTSDSDINIEVWMPFTGWNGRYLGTATAALLAFFSILPWPPFSSSTMPWPIPTWAHPPRRPIPSAAAC